MDISVADRLILAPFDVVVDNWFLHCIVGSDRDKVLNCISRSMSRYGVLLGSNLVTFGRIWEIEIRF